MPASSAASTVAAVVAASVRQPKLLHPRPTRDTLRDHSMRYFMSVFLSNRSPAELSNTPKLKNAGHSNIDTLRYSGWQQKLVRSSVLVPLIDFHFNSDQGLLKFDKIAL